MHYGDHDYYPIVDDEVESVWKALEKQPANSVVNGGEGLGHLPKKRDRRAYFSQEGSTKSWFLGLISGPGLQ